MKLDQELQDKTQQKKQSNQRNDLSFKHENFRNQ